MLLLLCDEAEIMSLKTFATLLDKPPAEISAAVIHQSAGNPLAASSFLLLTSMEPYRQSV